VGAEQVEGPCDPCELPNGHAHDDRAGGQVYHAHHFLWILGSRLRVLARINDQLCDRVDSVQVVVVARRANRIGPLKKAAQTPATWDQRGMGGGLAGARVESGKGVGASTVALCEIPALIIPRRRVVRDARGDSGCCRLRDWSILEERLCEER